MRLLQKLSHAICALGAVYFLAACHDVDFDGTVERPAFRENGPVILFDEGHHNHHSLRSTYAPFAKLLKNDGFEVRKLSGPLSANDLATGRILTIVTAQSDTETNDAPAFTPGEVGAILSWVRDGGSLLLVTDHYPFPNAVEPLAAALGLEVAKGMTFDARHFRSGTEDDSRLIFSRENGLLARHPIIEGRNPAERVSVVETFTGDAFRPHNAGIQPLLQLADTAVNRVGRPNVSRQGGDVVVTVEFGDPVPASGWVQGAAFGLGRGRVVALAESAMITAQEDGGRKLGMNAPGNDNRQFLLNVIHWLARVY